VPNYRLEGQTVPVVEIYTKTFCGYCWKAKHLLDSKGIEYREIAVDLGGEVKQQMIERSSGRTTVPQIFIGDVHVGGCTELLALEIEGRLDELLAA
jgi:glutaredoxin 3